MNLIIPDVPKSLNVTQRMHWTVRRKYNMQWRWLVRSQFLILPDPVERRKVLHIHQVRRRKLDKDNLYGSVKPIVDALKHYSFIWEDSPDWLDLTVTQSTGIPVRTMIEVY